MCIRDSRYPAMHLAAQLVNQRSVQHGPLVLVSEPVSYTHLDVYKRQIVITAPMKNEINNTMPMEFTPSCCISLIYCLRNIRIRSGRENERPIPSNLRRSMTC